MAEEQTFRVALILMTKVDCEHRRQKLRILVFGFNSLLELLHLPDYGQ
jgi:hypothetical protein